MRFLDALHHLKDSEVEIAFAAHTAQPSVDDAGGPVNVEAKFHHAADHGFDLLFGWFVGIGSTTRWNLPRPDLKSPEST